MKKFCRAALIIVSSVGFFALSQGQAQSRSNTLLTASDPRATAELTVCSQNLDNFGSYADIKQKNPNLTLPDFQAKEDALVKRMAAAHCDIIALQEILGKNEANAEKVLQLLAVDLKKLTNRYFETRVGPSNDPMMRNGFLTAKDRVEIQSVQSYAKVELPKLTESQKPRFFTRGPLELQVQVKGQGGASPKTVAIITFHFKSKVGGADDPTGLEWETLRMEMAEALRRIVETRHAQSFNRGETLLVLLGDRNAEFNSATAKILEGVLTLKQFQGEGVCRLSKKGLPLCQAGAVNPQRLFSLLTGDPQTKSLPGTFSKGKNGSWIDDILVPAETLAYARADAYVEGDYASGIVYGNKDASDHALVWARFNW